VTTDITTIDQVLDAFLQDQRQRLSAHTMRNYEDVMELLRACLNGYAYESLDKADRKRFDQAYEAGDEEAFCHLFGPEHILGNLAEFLGYFMLRKVMAGQELLRSAGTVTKKLATWLYEHGYVSDDEAQIAVDRGTDAARDLPRAERLANLLHDQSRAVPDFDLAAIVNGPVEVGSERGSRTCPNCAAQLSADPATAEVRRMLTASGRRSTLLEAIDRCPRCRSPLPGQ
jgi:hypothetical protein